MGEASHPSDTTLRRPRIVVVRHGRPALDRNAGPRLMWRDYVDWWSRYEQSSLAPGQIPPPTLIEAVKPAARFLASVRPRAIETAEAIAAGRPIETDPVFVEASLPPPVWPETVRFLPKTWNMIARTAWLMGHSLEDEPRTEAQVRAGKAADRLVAVAESEGFAALCAHGWFNRMLRPELARRGWRCVRDGGDSYWSFRIYEPR